jgi:hypothetical protein
MYSRTGNAKTTLFDGYQLEQARIDVVLFNLLKFNYIYNLHPQAVLISPSLPIFYCIPISQSLYQDFSKIAKNTEVKDFNLPFI